MHLRFSATFAAGGNIKVKISRSGMTRLHAWNTSVFYYNELPKLSQGNCS